MTDEPLEQAKENVDTAQEALREAAENLEKAIPDEEHRDRPEPVPLPSPPAPAGEAPGIDMSGGGQQGGGTTND